MDPLRDRDGPTHREQPQHRLEQRREQEPDDERDGALRSLEQSDLALEVDRLGPGTDVGRDLSEHQGHEREREQPWPVRDGERDAREDHPVGESIAHRVVEAAERRRGARRPRDRAVEHVHHPAEHEQQPREDGVSARDRERSPSGQHEPERGERVRSDTRSSEEPADRVGQPRDEVGALRPDGHQPGATSPRRPAAASSVSSSASSPSGTALRCSPP